MWVKNVDLYIERQHLIQETWQKKKVNIWTRLYILRAPRRLILLNYGTFRAIWCCSLNQQS